MVISSLCPISVEGVIRELRWGIGPEGAEALSSHHLWMFIPPVGQHRGEGGERGYIWMDEWMDKRMDGQNGHSYVMRREGFARFGADA
jgi:hypothetical protein